MKLHWILHRVKAALVLPPALPDCLRRDRVSSSSAVDGIGLCLAGRLHQAIDVPSSTWVLEKLQVRPLYSEHTAHPTSASSRVSPHAVHAQGREGFELQLEKQVPLEWRYPIKVQPQ